MKNNNNNKIKTRNIFKQNPKIQQKYFKLKFKA